ncbi:SurA N-terminal domain-containing protein [Coralloluteibacterium thermophilus]|uniref:Periplasmic chaperone PpiD n=1 Tax=Coralloluteibacterium thermophilum TaxID=2707049 RepID=A0ABV9NJA1_9GAMM
MLQKLREKTTGWIAVVIIGLLAIPFVFVGVERYAADDMGTHVARIESPPTWWPSAPHAWPVRMLWDRHEITQQQFQERFQLYRQQVREQLGEQFDARDFDTPETRRQMVDRLVDEELLRLEALRGGMQATDVMVFEQIASEPAFQVDGQFDRERYRMTLLGAGLTPLGYQQSVRNDLQVRLLPTEITESTVVADAEVREFLRLSGQTRDLRWLEVPAAEDVAEPDAATLEAFHRDHAAAYRQPEQVALEYVEITPEMLPEVGEPSEAALRRLYEEQSNRFTQADQRLASHILVAVAPDADEAAVQAARERAEDIAAQARAEGADFAALAREASEDLGSRAAGGDLGWLEPGVADGAFEQALYTLEPGEVSDPVRTGEGWHVIQLREVRGGQRQSFESVRETLASEYVRTTRERAYSELSGRLIDRVYQDPTALAPAAEELELPLRTTAPFARGEGEGIAAHPEVQRAAFSEAGLRGEVSDAIELGANHLVLVRVREHRPAEPLPLESIRERVVADYLREQRAEAARVRAEALLARVRAGETLDALAEAETLALRSAAGVVRNAQAPAPELVAEAFRLPHPQDGVPAYGIARVGENYVVLAVDAVAEGDTALLTGPLHGMMRNQLAQLYASVEMRDYIDALRRQYRITVMEDRLR